LIPGDHGRVEPMGSMKSAPPVFNVSPTIVVQGKPDKRTRHHIGRELAEELRVAQRMN
jgi:hypothetical protein